MRGWMFAGIFRKPGPLIGTAVASAVAGALTVAAVSIALAHTTVPAGPLASASVVVAGDTNLKVSVSGGESTPLVAYRGVAASLAQRLDQVPGVATATGESGFPGGVVRPGDVDLIAVTAKPGVAADVLASRIRTALPKGEPYTVATGTARGNVANLTASQERELGTELAGQLIPYIVAIALLVLMTTTALAVDLRTRRFALLRTIGATRGQVRRAIMAELTVCGVAGGVVGFLGGITLGTLGTNSLASHQLLPSGSSAWLSPWLLLIACGASGIAAGLSGQIAARRGSRTAPAKALRETSAERRWPHPVRILLGCAAAGGAGSLAAVTFSAKSQADIATLAFPLLIVSMLAVTFLGPLLVAAIAWLAKPLRSVGGPSMRLALAAISSQPRRTASAVIPVAMAVAMIGAVYFSNASVAHAASIQAGSTVTADRVISGGGLTPATLRQAQALPGVRAAAGVTAVSVEATDPDLDQVNGQAVAGGPLTELLNLGVTAGSLATLGAGQIAVSTLEASHNAMNVHLGSRVTVYMPDGTPYHATVSALYAHSLASGDLLIPASVVAGHTGTAPAFNQLLVTGGTQAALAGLVARHPGSQLASRSVANAQASQQAAQDGFANNLILGLIAALAAVTLLNTLVVATLERRRALRLLGRVGATRGQAAGVFAWHAVFVTATGLFAGVAAGGVTLLAVTKASIGSWTPFVPIGPAAGIVVGVAALTAAAILIPFGMMSRREPTFVAAA